MQSLNTMDKEFGCLDFLLTLSLFAFTVVLLPWLILCYIGIFISHNIWLALITFLNPELEFIKSTTLRTLVDTHRNQGIITVLLTVRGPANPSSVRRHLEELVRRKDKSGSLVFPRLKDCLVTRCGTYAWQKGSFDLEQNLIFASYIFRGRPVNELSIQDCVSDIVSKYLPAGIPPWQVVIIPSSDNYHYILVRLHHILLSEGLNIADMLPLVPPVRSMTAETSESRNALTDVIKPPEDIPALKERLTEEFSNRWNEFISNHDPLEKPELYKRSAGFFELLAIVLIVAVSTFKECRRGFQMIESDILSKLKYVKKTFSKECKKRHVNLLAFIKSVFVSTDPRNVVKIFFKKFLYISLLGITVPVRIYTEIKALHTCFSLDYCAYPHTFVGLVYNYVPLLYKATKEVLYYCNIIYTAPRSVFDELTRKYETIQTVTLCGRKVVAWSEPVKTDIIKKIARSTGVSETEVILATASEALSRFVVQTNNIPPKEIPITARNVSSNYLFLTGNNVKARDSLGGMLCINLPILDSRKDANLLENLCDIKVNFSYSRETQQLTYLLSMFQTKYGFLSKFLPATFLSIALKYLSLKYSVSYTEVTSRQPFVMQKTIWGQEVSSVIYWRPPQANISISMCVNQYGQNIVVGTMCDAQLAPNHHLLVRGFPEYVKDLASSADVQ